MTRDAIEELICTWMRYTDMYSPEGCPLALSRSQQQDLVAIVEEMGADRAAAVIAYACENWDKINRALGAGRWVRSPRIALVREHLEPIARAAGMAHSFETASAA